jgi:CRISPR system Cascade subunit CasE
MYLSRITLRPDAPRHNEFWRLAEDDYRAHREVWNLFTDGPALQRDFLYRIDVVSGRIRIYTLSSREPKVSSSLWGLETKEFRPTLQAGDRLRFALRVNPVVTRNGKRHDVVMEAKRLLRERGTSRDAWPQQAALAQQTVENWLRSRSEKHGFSLEGVRVDAHTSRRFLRRGGQEVRLATCDLEGVLTVARPDAFLQAVARGIGPAKGFGCGLLLLARVDFE